MAKKSKGGDVYLREAVSAPAGPAPTSTCPLIIAELIGLPIRYSLHQSEEIIHQYLNPQDLLGIVHPPYKSVSTPRGIGQLVQK